MTEAETRFEAWRSLVTRELESTFAPRESCPEPLFEAMRYAMMAGGKRLRPLLVLASCAAAGGRDEDALPAALAIEMIHTYSLVHDDLPAMDDDDLRRGRPTTHVVYGEALAILAGDALHTYAFETLGASHLPPARVRAQLATLARAAGPAGMAGGQVLDLLAEGQEPNEGLVRQIHRLKTGALLAAAHRLGAEGAGAAAELATHFEAIGHKVGLAFQIQDDVLDVTSTTEELGKTVGKDEAAGKATWPALVGLEESKRRAKALMEEALAEIDGLEGDTAPLAFLVRKMVERRK